MRPCDGIQHRENIIDACVIRARHPLTLPRTPVFVSTLCRVRQGEKLVQWDDREMRAGPNQLILMPAGRELGISNFPGPHGHYIADAVTFPVSTLRNFSTRYSQQIMSCRGVLKTDLCVPLDRHTTQAWEQLLAAINGNAPQGISGTAKRYNGNGAELPTRAESASRERSIHSLTFYPIL